MTYPAVERQAKSHGFAAVDVIYLDSGNYTLLKNLVLGPQDSGVRIEGPTGAAAVLNRANTATGSYVIQMNGATGVTHRPTGLAFGPDGSLYVADDAAGRLYRIMYTGRTR